MTNSLSTSSSLPIPSKELLLQSQHLQSLISTELKNKGTLSFAEFMHYALYTPNLGFYTSSREKFGIEGDFITAPHISPVFSQCLARQCADILSSITHSSILEIGAGSGQMAKDILLTLEKEQCLPEYYFILELSPALKKRQQNTLASLSTALQSKIIWLDNLPQKPFVGVILANEVLDALPFHCFQVENNQLFERRVSLKKTSLQKVSSQEMSLQEAFSQEDQFCFINTPIFDDLLSQKLKQVLDKNLFSKDAPYCSEINLNVDALITKLSEILTHGVMLFIDYGFSEKEFYHPDRFMGTLMCHYRHFAHHDPFLYPGLQDITMHVDFTNVAEIAHHLGCDILGFTNQAHFLLNTGLMEGFNANSEHHYQHTQAINLLTSPAEMGELFKVLAIGKNFEESLIGFKINDLRYSL